MQVRNTGEAASEYQRVTLTGQYLLSALAIRRTLADREGPIDCLLDFGCGGGKSLWPSIPFVARNGRAIGVDVSEQQLALAENNAIPVRIEREDLDIRFTPVPATGQLLGVESGTVDVVQTSIVLQEIRQEEVLARLMGEVSRVLRPGGWFVAACVGDRITSEDYVSFTYAGFEDNLNTKSRVRACRSLEGDFVWTDDHHWTRAELETACHDAGLSTRSIEDVYGKREWPPFPAEPWRCWKDEIESPPVFLAVMNKDPE